MSALFHFQSLVTVILLLICTCTYIRSIWPSLLDQRKTGILGGFWKCARIGERLSPYVALACILVAFQSLFFNWEFTYIGIIIVLERIPTSMPSMVIMMMVIMDIIIPVILVIIHLKTMIKSWWPTIEFGITSHVKTVQVSLPSISVFKLAKLVGLSLKWKRVIFVLFVLEQKQKWIGKFHLNEEEDRNDKHFRFQSSHLVFYYIFWRLKNHFHRKRCQSIVCTQWSKLRKTARIFRYFNRK